MATLYNRIALLCEKKQVSFTRMLVDIGVSRSLKQKLQDNPEKTITLKTAQKMADYFGVSVDDILGAKKAPTPIAESECSDPLDARLNELLAQASEDTKKAMIVLLEQSQKH